MSEAKEVESTRMVSVSLLETLTQIACDYINPNGERHHGIPPVSHSEAHRAIKEAGNILDTNYQALPRGGEQKGNDHVSSSTLVRLCNAITEAIREMEQHPDDSVQDIWSESLDSWETGLYMDHNYNVVPKRR